MERTVFDRKFEYYDEETDKERQKNNKSMSAVREIVDRLRRKVDENSHAMLSFQAEIDSKMSSKEGQKVWANFRKYAQYEELKELYRKTMPAISSFEDKLQKNNDHNERIDKVLVRLDEVLCNKADRQSVKEFREFVEV